MTTEELIERAMIYADKGPANRYLREALTALDAEQEKEDLTTAVKSAVDVIMDAVVETIGIDGHQWSDRPCQTCRAVSGMIGRPYGCYWYQALAGKERAK